MGWSRGSELAGEVWDLVRAYIPEKKRKEVSGKIMDMFEDADADDFSDDMQIVQDAGRAYEDG